MAGRRRRTYSGGNRPHLATVALSRLSQLAESGVRVEPSAICLLLILCDRVSSTHGQWYGSASKLAESLPWERHWVSKWLYRLEAHGLVENLGPQPGRRLTTWQLLPWLYPVEATEDSSWQRAHPPVVEALSTGLVEALEDPLVEPFGATNTKNTNHEFQEHLFTRAAAERRKRSLPQDEMIRVGELIELECPF